MQGAERDTLISAHLEWARRRALSIRRKHGLGPHISHEDTVAVAHLALVEAATRYRAGRTEFVLFAYQRIVGAVLDWCRETSGGYRSVSVGGRWSYPPGDAPLEAARFHRDPAPDPLERAELAEALGALPSLLARATPREREALRLYWLDDLSLAEVGARLGVSESRACQLTAAGIARIRRQRG